MNRLVTAVVSAALLGFTPVALAPTAGASEAVVATTSASASTGKAVAAAPDARMKKRSITISGFNRGRQAFITGLVRPRYARGPVIVQKGVCKAGSCTFKRHSRVRTNARSRYTAKVFVPREGGAVFRVMVPRSRGFATSYSPAKKFTWR